MINNVVIKVLNRDHGQKVKEYFLSNNIDVSGYDFTDTCEDGSPTCYYGVINDTFGSYEENELFYYVKTIELPSEKTFPRMMWVWNNSTKKHKRMVLHKLDYNMNRPYIALAYVSSEKQAIDILNSNRKSEASVWKFAEEIIEPQIEEMTLKQVCKELGREIKIVK